MPQENLLAALRAAAPDTDVADDLATRRAYSGDATFQQRLPDVVAWPVSTADVCALLRVANDHAVPVVPRGAGTSLAGGAVPITGGLVLSLERMARIVEIDSATTTATVQSGVVNGDLQRAAARHGLFYPPDPASLETCTLGGNVACDAGGPRCLKYGVTKDYVLGMTVVLMDGRALHLGGKLLKNATGYQLAQLFVGSEGTLGVITELVLRLLPLPPARATVSAVFPDLDAASVAVTGILGAGILPTTMELLDAVTLRALEQALHVGLAPAAEAMLIIEQDGTDAPGVRAQIEDIARLCMAHGALAVDIARDEADRDRIWAARRGASEALRQMRPNKLGEDIVVPRDKIPEMVRRIERIASASGLMIAVLGHAGDGNLHPNILFDRTEPGIMQRVEDAAAAIFRAALELGGTLSGEHGVGLLKRAFLGEAIGADELALMLGIKQLFDPRGLLNPGKLFPVARDVAGDGHRGFLTDLPTADSFATG